MWSALYRLKASSCWFTHSFNRWREKKFVLTWQRTLLMKEQLVVTLHLTFVAANIFLRNCLACHLFPMETIDCPHQGKAAPLFVCPAQRQWILLLEGGGNFWHNFNLWRANGQWSINVVFVTQPLKIDIPNPDRYDECQVYTSCGGRKTKKDQSADQHWSHLALGSPEPVTCRAPAWSRYRNMRRLKKWPFSKLNGFCLPKG